MNSNKKVFVILICLVVTFSFIYFNKAKVSDTQFPENNTYKIQATYDKEKRLLKGYQILEYTNRAGKDLEELKFHLFANAYRDLKTVPEVSGDLEHYPEGFNEGKTTIKEVKANEEVAEFKVDNQILSVKLKKKLLKGESVKIEMEFEDLIPKTNNNYGVYDGITSLAYWYPILAVHDGSDWQTREYGKIGESSYSDMANYYVNITLPEDEITVSTGIKTGEHKEEKGYKKVEMEALNVRDFVIISSDKFVKKEKKAGEITINSYFLPENKAAGEATLKYGEKALKYFENLIGPYPYKELDIAETNMINSGMEYPQLLSVGRGLYEEEENLKNSVIFETTVVHEAAHQWFYGIIGNDQQKEPWLDESFVTYLTAKYFKDNGREEIFNQQVKNNESKLKEYKSVFSTVNDFDGWNSYLDTVYKRGSLVLYKLNEDMGEEKFKQLLQEIYKEYKYKNLNTEKFLDILTKTEGEERSQIFKEDAVKEKKAKADINKNIKLSDLPVELRRAKNASDKVIELKNKGYSINMTFDFLAVKGDANIVYGTEGNEEQNKDMRLAAEMILETSIEQSSMKKQSEKFNGKVVTDKEALDMKEMPDLTIIVGNPDINGYYKEVNDKLDIQIHGNKISIVDLDYDIKDERYFFSYLVDNYADEEKKIMVFYSRDGTGISTTYRGYYYYSTFGGGIKYNPDFLGLIAEKDGKKEVMIFDEEGKVKE